MAMGVPQDSQNVSQSTQSVPTQVEAHKTAPEEGGILARTDSQRSIISDNGSESSPESLTDHKVTADLPSAPGKTAEKTEVLPKPDFGPPPAPPEEGSDTLEGEAAPLNDDEEKEEDFLGLFKEGVIEKGQTREGDTKIGAHRKRARFDENLLAKTEKESSDYRSAKKEGVPQEKLGKMAESVKEQTAATSKLSENAKKFTGVIKNSLQKKYESAKPALDKGQKLAGRLATNLKGAAEASKKIAKFSIQKIKSAFSNKMSDAQFQEFNKSINETLSGPQGILYEDKGGTIDIDDNKILEFLEKLEKGVPNLTSEQKQELSDDFESWAKNNSNVFEGVREQRENDGIAPEQSIKSYAKPVHKINNDYRDMFARIISDVLETKTYDEASEACNVGEPAATEKEELQQSADSTENTGISENDFKEEMDKNEGMLDDALKEFEKGL